MLGGLGATQDRVCVLQNLVFATDLNGHHCKLWRYDAEASKSGVRLDDKTFMVKPANLKPLDEVVVPEPVPLCGCTVPG